MTPWVLRLLIANIVMFLVAAPGTPLFQLLMFVPAWVLQRPWTPLTYMFLHANMAHILFNMLGLYFFGPRVEVRIGSRDFILLYLAAGLAGALLSFFFESVPIVGASGAIFGVLLAFAHFWPDERIYLWFILPVPARLMVIGTGMSIGSVLMPSAAITYGWRLETTSMAMVDEPHMGLTKGDRLSHFVAMTVDAASDSSIGAFPGIFLYPCLESVSPEVSRKSSARFSRQNKWITVLSWAGPLSGRLFVFSRMASAIDTPREGSRLLTSLPSASMTSAGAAPAVVRPAAAAAPKA